MNVQIEVPPRGLRREPTDRPVWEPDHFITWQELFDRQEHEDILHLEYWLCRASSDQIQGVIQYTFEQDPGHRVAPDVLEQVSSGLARLWLGESSQEPWLEPSVLGSNPSILMGTAKFVAAVAGAWRALLALEPNLPPDSPFGDAAALAMRAVSTPLANIADIDVHDVSGRTALCVQAGVLGFRGRHKESTSLFLKAVAGKVSYESPPCRFAAYQLVRAAIGCGLGRAWASSELDTGKLGEAAGESIPLSVGLGLGVISMGKGEYADARHWLERVVSRPLDAMRWLDVDHVAFALFELASIAWFEDRTSEALELLERSRQTSERLDEWYIAATRVLQRAEILDRMGQSVAAADARACTREQLQRCSGDLGDIAAVLHAVMEDAAWREDVEWLRELAHEQSADARAQVREALAEEDIWVWHDDADRNAVWTARLLEVLSTPE